MSRDKRYQRLLNTKQWRELRAWKLQKNPLCELCQDDGFVRAAIDVHHKIPVESAHSEKEMERLAFNPSNLQSLCIPCHIKVHQDMRTHIKEKVRENKQRARQRFLEANDPSYQPLDQLT